MQMDAFPVCLDRYPLPLLLYLEASRAATIHSSPHPSSSLFPGIRNPIPIPQRTTSTIASLSSVRAYSKPTHSKFFRFSPNSSKVYSIALFDDNDTGDGDGPDPDDDDDDESVNRGGGDGIDVEVEKIGNNCRRIRSKVAVEASLQTVWNILTDYERLADFIPGLVVCQLLEKRDNFARIFQIGQQNLAFGLNFNAKGIIDCYERDLESFPFSQRRDIEFKMIEGDFQLFEGKWSIEQCMTGRCEQSNSLVGQEFHTTLSYVVDVEPKLWLPVRLVEGRVCREIKKNLSSIRMEAQKAFHNTLPSY